VTTAPDISFVVPLFNAAPWVEQCIRSLLSQTATRLEVVCVDDGSTDAGCDIVRRIIADDPRVTLLQQSNAGQSVARNVGMRVARGRYLAFVDSDDYWGRDIAADLIARADADDLDVLLFDGRAVRDGDVDDSLWSWYSTYYRRRASYRRVRSGAELAARMRRRGDYKPHLGLYVANRAFAQTAGLTFIPGIVHQDNPFTFRLMLAARRAAHRPIDVYVRRLRPGSTITSLGARRSVEGYLTAHQDMRDALNAERRSISRRDRRALTDIVDYTARAAQKKLDTLTDEETRQVLDDLASRGVPHPEPVRRRPQ